MKNRRVIFSLFIFIFFSLVPLFSSPYTATTERYLISANEQYSLENFSKAYTYINYVLEKYDENTCTLEVKLIAELIYFDYLCKIEEKNDLESFLEYQDRVIDFPYIVSERIQEKLDYLVPVFQKVASNDEANIIAKTVYLNTCQTFTYLSINNITYYSNYDSLKAPMIVEIVPTDNYLYKLVYAEPLNTTWALRYITLYLSSEDIIEITLVSSSSPIKGSVSSGKTNLIELTIKP